MGEHHGAEVDRISSAQDALLSDWKALNLNVMQIQEDNLNTLIDIWPSIKECQESETRWGDEIEYVLLKLDHGNQFVRVSPNATQVIETLGKDKSEDAVDIQREAYEYMVETSPWKPYSSDLQTLTKVEPNMTHRRKMIQRQLDPTTAVFSLSRFGMYGALHCKTPDGIATPESVKEEAGSLITQGARYRPVFEAIAKKRGHQMNGEAWLYDNSQSLASSTVSSASSDSGASSTADSVIIDDPIYAVGGCAVQVNFGAKDMSEALYLHDQFCPVGPLMLAMTAASPILKGYLVDTDGRWNHCILASDDRSPEESNIHARWGTSPMYFEDQPEVQTLNHTLNSNHEGINDFTKQLREAGLPTPLATYYAHALTRDPMLHPKSIPGTTQDGDLNDPVTRLKTHLSALWPHIRLKFPSTDGTVPWIVEFRSMETQPSDHEIAAVTVFLKLLQQTILHFRLELRIPIHLVDVNMRRAQIADAVEEQKFYFNTTNSLTSPHGSSTATVQELSLHEIFNGQSSSSDDDNKTTPFPGLLSYVREYLTLQATATSLAAQDLAKISSYIDLISRRASGAEPTPAKWMRDFVMNHPDYNGDSQVSSEMYYEMMCRIGERSKIWA